VVLSGDVFEVRRPLEVLVRGPYSVTGTYLSSSRAVELRVANASATERHATLRISGALWEAPVEAEAQIAPRGAATLAIPLGAGRSLDKPTDVTVDAIEGDETERFTVQVRPPVLNPGFETTSAAGRPAMWSYQNETLATTDEQGAAEGQRSLKLTGKLGAFLEAHQSIPVETGASYTVECKVRRSPGEARNAGPAIVLLLKAGGERYVHLKPDADGPADEWRTYSATFTAGDDVRDTALYLYNVDSTATVWFDDVRLQ